MLSKILGIPNKVKAVIGMSIIIVTVAAVSVGVSIGWNILEERIPFDIIHELTIEAGTLESIQASDFIENYEYVRHTMSEPATLTPFSEFSRLGSHELLLEIGEYSVPVVLTIVDTVPPTADPVEHHIFSVGNASNEVEAGDFVTNIQDVTEVSVSFASPIDFDRLGWQDVAIMLTDEGNNVTEISSRLYIFGVIEELTLEIGLETDAIDTLTARHFIRNYDDAYALDARALDLEGDFNLSSLGSHDLTLAFGEPLIQRVVKNLRIRQH